MKDISHGVFAEDVQEKQKIIPVDLYQFAPYIAEGIGTFGLVFAGCGAIMINGLSGGQISHLGVGLVFGLIITVMIYAFGHISGAHFNPAVTLAFVLVRHFPIRQLLGYWFAQFAGATLAALCLRLLLGNVSSLGATLPAGSGGAWQSFGLEAILTFFLMIVIMAMATDTRAVGQADRSCYWRDSSTRGNFRRANMWSIDEPCTISWACTYQWDMDSSMGIYCRTISWCRNRCIHVPLAAQCRQGRTKRDT